MPVEALTSANQFIHSFLRRKILTDLNFPRQCQGHCGGGADIKPAPKHMTKKVTGLL